MRSLEIPRSFSRLISAPIACSEARIPASSCALSQSKPRMSYHARMLMPALIEI